MSETSLKRLMSRGQVSQRLSLSPERVRQLSQQGHLPYQDSPLGRLYDPDGVEAYAAQRERLGEEPQS